MTKKNKKKTAREKRILVGAFLTAVVIAAGSTFAWFTSTDTVTNRLSANADYNVKIVESFAPPENWMPGDKVDKDVYAVNTGNIEAFAKATISGMMSITREVPVPITDAIYTEPQPSGDATWYQYGSSGWGDALLDAPTATKIDGDVLVGGGTVDGPTDGTVIYEDEDDEGGIITVDEPVHDLMYVATETGVTFYYRAGNSMIYKSGGGDDPWAYTDLDAYPEGAKSYTGGTVSYGTPATNIPTDATHYSVDSGNVIWYKAVNETSTGGWDFTGENLDSVGVYNCVELTPNQVYAIEAGAFLAWKPIEDNVNTAFGNKAIGFKEPTVNGGTADSYYYTPDNGVTKTPVSKEEYEANEGNNSYVKVPGTGTPEGEPTNAPKTDFKPHADGLYVFRRSIVVNGDENSHAAGTETFKYEGYYFLGGKYYKITNLNTTLDTSKAANGIAGDGTTKDGVLSAATACLVKEEKQYFEQPKSFEYDSAYNRLIATYDTDTTSKIVGTGDNLDALAKALDKAQHELVEAEVLLERTLADKGIVDNAVKKESAEVDEAAENYKKALEEYNAAVAQFEDALSDYNSGKNALEVAKDDAKKALNDLVGDNGSVTGTSTAADIAADEWDGTDTLSNGNATIVSSAATAPANIYGNALKTYNDWIKEYQVLTDAEKDEKDQIIYTYLVELSKKSTAGGGCQYELPPTWGGETAPTGVTHDDLMAQLVVAASKITYTFASSNVQWAGDPATLTPDQDEEFHRFNQYFMALKVAEKDYNDALTEYNTRLANLNKAIKALGTGNDTTFTEITAADTVTENFIDGFKAWNSKMADNLRTAYTDLHAGDDVDQEDSVLAYKPLTEEQVQTNDKDTLGGAEKTLRDAWDKLQKEKRELDAVRDETFINVEGDGLPYAGPRFTDSPDNTQVDEDNIDDPSVKANLQAAWDNYYTKRNLVDEAQSKLDAAKKGFDNNGDIKIYIYLQNVSLTGEKPEQWQLLPTALTDDKAVFYYTSILGAGEVSEQLVDYVELDGSVTKEMYKTFDYDLNIVLDSAQVTYADDSATIRTAEAANKMFTWTDSQNNEHKITGSIKNPLQAPPVGDAANQTIVSWSDSEAISETQPESPVEPEPTPEPIPAEPTYTVDNQEVTVESNTDVGFEVETATSVFEHFTYRVYYRDRYFYSNSDSGEFTSYPDFALINVNKTEN